MTSFSQRRCGRIPALLPVLLCLTSADSALVASPPSAVQSAGARAHDGAAVAGLLPGSERWIVHFESRSFDLSALEAEMRGARDPSRVEALIQGLEDRVERDQAAFVQAARALGARVTEQYWLINACTIEVAPAVLPAIRAIAGVRALEADQRWEPCIKTATNARNHGSAPLHAQGIRGAGIGIAIVDSGQDERVGPTNRPHVVYRERTSSATRLVVNRKIGAMPADDVEGYGTGVASIAAGIGWASARAGAGHAHDAKICGYAIANDVRGNTTSTTKVRAFEAVARDAARYSIRVLNLSYSGSPDPARADSLALSNLARSFDILCCTAAGNYGTNTQRSMINVNGLSVGAVHNDTHALASFSSRGLADGQIFPDICANGVDVVMAKRDAETSDYVGSGTSMASPQVAGIGAMLRAARRTMSANETRALLLATSRRTPQTSTRQVHGPGVGYANAGLPLVLGGRRGHVGSHGLLQGEALDLDVQLTRGQIFQFAVAWMRRENENTRWSNLDLELYRGQQLLARSATARNSEEFLRVAIDVTGMHRVRVVATRVTGAEQRLSWASTAPATARVPNLRLSSYQHPLKVFAGGAPFLGVRVRNDGNARSRSCALVQLLSTGPRIDANSIQIFRVQIPALNPGATFNASRNAPIPSYLGNFSDARAATRIDPAGEVLESNEGDNERITRITIGASASRLPSLDFLARYSPTERLRREARAITVQDSRAARIGIRLTSRLSQAGYSMLLLSGSDPLRSDAFTNFGLSLLNTPVFAGFFQTSTQPAHYANFAWPGGVSLRSDVDFFVHGRWFDRSFRSTGSSSRPLAIRIVD